MHGAAQVQFETLRRATAEPMKRNRGNCVGHERDADARSQAMSRRQMGSCPLKETCAPVVARDRSTADIRSSRAGRGFEAIGASRSGCRACRHDGHSVVIQFEASATLRSWAPDSVSARTSASR